MRMIEVCLFALGVGTGYGLSTLSIYMGNKMADNMVQKFTAPVQTEDEPSIDTEVNPIYDFSTYEETLKEYIGTDTTTKDSYIPDDSEFKEVN